MLAQITTCLAVFGLCLASSAPAHAADPLCGATLTADLVLTEDLDCTRFTGTALTIGADNITISGNGYRILAPDSAKVIDITNRQNATVQDLAIESWCRGAGVFISGGAGHTLDNLTITGQDRGVYATNTTNLTLTDLTVTASATTAIYLDNITKPLAITRVALPDNAAAFFLQNFTGPLTFGPTSFTDFARSDTGIYLGPNVSQLTLSGFAVHAYDYGIRADGANLTDLTLEDLDLSGPYNVGSGALLGSPGQANTANLTVRRVLANRRSYGVSITSAQNVTVDTLTANVADVAGLYLQQIATPLALTALTAEDSAIGLHINNFHPSATWSLGPSAPSTPTGAIKSLARADTAIRLENTENLLVHDLVLTDNPVYAIHAYATGNQNLTFDHLDLSGPYAGAGTGLWLYGPGHTVNDVTLALRGYGILASATPDLTLTNLAASGCASAAVRIDTLAATDLPPTLTNLTLAWSTVALQFANVKAPVTLSAATQLDTTTSLTGVTADASCANLTVQGLAFANPTTGLSLSGTNHTVTGVDVSGTGRGTGLILSGTGHTVTGVVASKRATGLDSSTSALTLTNLTAEHDATGLSLQNLAAAAVPATLSVLTLRHNTTGLYVNAVQTTTPTILDGTAQTLTLADNATDIRLTSTANVRVQNLTLSGYLNGVTGSSNTNLTLQDVDASAPSYGTSRNGWGTIQADSCGIRLDGGNPTLTLTRVTANGRATGISLQGPAGATLTNLTAKNARGTGLALSYLGATATPPTLTNVDLRDNGTGLAIYFVASPLTLNAATNLNVTGSATGIVIHGSQDITVDGVPFGNNRSFGVYADYDDNKRLTLKNLDLSGVGSGTGLRFGIDYGSVSNFGGFDHVVENVIANDREVGLLALGATNLTIKNWTSKRCGIGISLDAHPNYNPNSLPYWIPPTLTNLTLEDNTLGLSISGWSRWDPGQFPSYDIGPYDPVTQTGAITSLAGNLTGIQVGGARDLVFHDFASRARSTGIFIGSSTDHLTFEGLDLSGPTPGTGYGIRLGWASYNGTSNYNNPNHVITNVDVSDRALGVLALGASNLTIAGLTADHATQTAVQIEGYTDNPTTYPDFIPPTLSGLDVSDSPVGLYLYRFKTRPTTYDLGGSALFTATTNTQTTLKLDYVDKTRVHDLTLPGALYGLWARGQDLTFDTLTLDGTGAGTGLYFTGINTSSPYQATLTNVTANLRGVGVDLNYVRATSLATVTARAATSTGISIANATLPLSLASLDVKGSATGLSLTGISGTGTVTVDASTLAQYGDTLSAVRVQSVSPPAVVTVDDAGLGLTLGGGGNHALALPTPDPRCGTTLTASLTLTADLDCRATTGNILTIGRDDLTIDGQGHKILAPLAANVVYASAQNNVTIKNLDLSTPSSGGNAINIIGGSGHVIDTITAERRAYGVAIANASDVTLQHITTRRATEAGVSLANVALPITLTALSLTDGNRGLRLADIDATAAPLTFTSANLSDLHGNQTSIELSGSDKHLSFVGPLTGLDGTAFSINARSTTHANLTFQNLDLSAPIGAAVQGTGISLFGDAHLVSGLTAARRSYGADLQQGDAVTLEHLTLTGASTAALNLDTLTDLTLTDLTLTDSAIGLQINNLDDPTWVLSPYVSGAGAITSLAGSTTGIQVSRSSGLSFIGLTLDNPSYGIRADDANNADLTFTNLTLSASTTGPGGGTGLRLRGPDHTLTGLVSNRRAYGVVLTSVTTTTLSGLTANGASEAGLRLESVTTPLTLTNLTLAGSLRGLWIAGLTGSAATPLVLDGTSTTLSFANSSTAIQIENANYLTVKNLTLPNSSFGVNACAGTNTQLTFQGLVVSGPNGLGTGLCAQGSALTVTGITANDRNIGVQLSNISNLTVTDLTARGNYDSGLYLSAITPPLALTKLQLDDNGRGLYFSGSTATALAPFDLGPYLTASQTGAVASIANCSVGIQLASVRYARIHDLNLDAADAGVALSDTNNRDITLEDLDVTPRRRAGWGLALQGFDHRLSDVTSTWRTTGLLVQTAGGLQGTNLAFTQGDEGLGLYNTSNSPGTYTAPVFSNLNVRDNAKSIVLSDWGLPTTIDASWGLNMTGSDTGIYLYSVSNLTVSGLSNLDQSVLGIWGYYRSLNLHVNDVNLSGHGLGTGVYLNQPSGALEQVVADRRSTGVSVNSALAALSFTNVAARQSGIGASLYGINHGTTPLSLSALDLQNNGTGLSMSSMNGAGTLALSGTQIDVGGSRTGVLDSGSSNLMFEDWTLDNPALGLKTYWVGSNIVIQRVNASGQGRGAGLVILKPATLTDVTANDRTTGVSIQTTASLSGVTATRDGTAIDGSYSGNLSLNAVHLRDSGLAFAQGYSSSPVDWGPTELTELSGNRRDLDFQWMSGGIRLHDLALHSTGTAIKTGWAPNLTLENVDVTGSCRGTGVSHNDAGLVASGVTAARRQTGINLQGLNQSISDSVIGGNVTGIWMQGYDANAATTVVTAPGNTATTFLVASVTNISAGKTLRIGLSPPEVGAVASVAGNTVTLAAPLSAIPPGGTTVTGVDARLTVQSSDICANGSGLITGNNLTPATTNYWRSSTGPQHSGNPGGTGDTISGTATTSSPFVTVPTDKANPYCNQAPVPDAGPPQSVCEGDTVTLDATASTDPDVEPLTYLWAETTALGVTLDDPTSATPTFIAPEPGAPPANSAVATLRLTVADDQIERTDTVAITIARGNKPPTADAGVPQTVDEGASVALSGTASDPEAGTLTVTWTQLSGRTVALQDANTLTPTFTAPLQEVGGAAAQETFVFKLSVTDVAPPGTCGGEHTADSQITVTASNVDHAPTANAGPDQAVTDSGAVTLDGAGSSDPDGDTLTYAWTQTGGPNVTLGGETTANPTFTPVQVACGGADTYTFTLTVADGFGGVDGDPVSVTVTRTPSDLDGDGHDDCVDLCPLDANKAAPGVCGCGVVDIDSDGDGSADCADACPSDPAKVAVGQCGCGVADTDSDGDLTPDCNDGCPWDATKTDAADCDPLAFCEDVPLPCPAGEVSYAYVSDATGALVGSIRCFDSAGVVDCERDPGNPNQLRVYTELLCPAAQPQTSGAP